MKQFQGPYKIKIFKQDSWYQTITIQIKPNDVFSWKGHSRSNFVITKQNIVVYSNYHQSSSGCSLIAYDLVKKIQLWKTNLKGLGPISHSKYFNSVNRLQNHPKYITAFGKESAGKYVELVNLKTGKTIGHRKVN